VLHDFSGEVAHHLVVSLAVEMRVGIADSPRIEQDRYCEKRKPLVRVGHVSHGLPKARPIKNAVTLMDDDVLGFIGVTPAAVAGVILKV
jgi:hypothetical protein